MILAGSASRREYVQRLGRILRPKENCKVPNGQDVNEGAELTTKLVVQAEIDGVVDIRQVSGERRVNLISDDLSLLKNVPLRGDMKLQLRAEFINAFNSPYFPAPVVSATSSTFGQISASNQSNYARRAQIGVKLVF